MYMNLCMILSHFTAIAANEETSFNETDSTKLTRSTADAERTRTQMGAYYKSCS